MTQGEGGQSKNIFCLKQLQVYQVSSVWWLSLCNGLEFILKPQAEDKRQWVLNSHK